ncbi:MAG: flagellar protein FliS [Ignavibacteria bacterium]|jgi:flagellar secretion chaperone FliS
MQNGILSNKRNPANSYLVKEILEADPKQIILKIYDYAILNCQKQDLAKTTQALQELINALKFDDENVSTISIGLLRLYQYCQDQMRKRNYHIVYKILSDLRSTWISIFNQK